MATNTEEIRRKLEAQASQRVNPLLKGLSMLTGGIAGELTGTNEQIRQQRLAKRALMEEQMAALREERMMEYMKAQEGERLRRQLQLDEAQRLAASKIRKQELEEKREALRPSMVGYLKARPDYQLGGSMAMPIPALEDTESLEEQVAYEKAREQQEQEAFNRARQAKLDEGRVYVSRNAAGDVTVQGPSDLVGRFQSANPDFFAKTKNSPYKVSMRETEDGRSFNVDFGEMTADEIEKIAPQLQSMKKAYGDFVDSQGALGNQGNQPAKPIKGPPADKDDPQVFRGTGKTRTGAAAAIAEEQAAPADMYGPLSPSEQFVQTGRRLGALEGRGGTSTYGAQQTLTGPFYEAVASELGVQPKRLGQESAIVRSAKAVVADEFPTEAWNKLPQEIKNRIYIEALNRSAAQMAAPPKPSVFSSGYAESPFAPYSYSR